MNNVIYNVIVVGHACSQDHSLSPFIGLSGDLPETGNSPNTQRLLTTGSILKLMSPEKVLKGEREPPIPLVYLKLKSNSTFFLCTASHLVPSRQFLDFLMA